MKPVRFLRPAEFEMLDAARYYELRQHGLGADFLDEIDSALADIQANPGHCPIGKHSIRKKVLSRFSYVLLYREDQAEIIIQAVMHTSRRPGYWYGR